MSKTKYINIEGTFKWAKLYEPDDFKGDLRWKTDFYPANERELDKIKDNNLMLGIKTDAEGAKFITVRRAVKKAFPKDDEVTYFTPPEIRGVFSVQYVNPETNIKLRSYKKSEIKEVRTVGEQVMIPNGTEGVINLSVYEASSGNGHRLEGVTITKLAEYVPKEDDVDLADEMNDEIPF